MAVAVAIAVIAVVVLVTGAPVAWVLLGCSAVLTASVLVVSLAEGRYFEPLTVVAAVAAVSFVARPLQLFIGAYDLLSYLPPPIGVDSLFELENQEVALFVTRDLRGALEPALTRAMLAVTLFLVLFTIGYTLPLGRRLAARASAIGRNAGREDMRRVVLACFALAAVGQVALLIELGGPVGLAEGSPENAAYKASVIYNVLVGFGLAGILVWAVWHPPETPRARAGLIGVTVELCVFYALTGSRTRVFLTLLVLAIASHYLRRPWRLRQFVAGTLVVVVVASSILAIRQATEVEPFGEALLSAPAYLVDPRGILNDFTEYDAIFYAVEVIGSDEGYRPSAGFDHGMGIVDAFRSYLPGFIDPDKPQSADQEFRELIFGDQFGAGRPYTVVGDLWNDFGYPGIVIGSLLFGLLARALLGLVGETRVPGRRYRVALYAIGVILVYVELTVTYSVTLGYVLTLAMPFLIAVHVVAPVVARPGSVRSRPRNAEIT